jgi:putative tricarboxylic transport membrane protein
MTKLAMTELTRRRVLRLAASGVAAGLCGAPLAAFSQAAWKPQKNVEFIVPTSAGSTMDLLARVIQDIWKKNDLVDATMTVQAKPGSGGAVAWTYLSRKTGDGHYIAISGPTLLANDVLGVGELKYKDVTPIAQLFTEYEVFAVNASSPIKTGADLVKALKSATPPSVGVAPGFGGSSHVALLKLARLAGIDANKLTVVPFKGANESVLSVLGGHTDVAIGTVSVVAPQLSTGKLRAFAVSAPKRLGGALSAIPTWKEQGLDLVEGNWRGIVGPKDLGPAEVAFWANRLAEVVKRDEWKANLERNYWDADFLTGAEARQFLDTQYEELRSTLANLAPAK